MLVDYHVHTRLCKHAVGEVEAYLAHAEKIGLTEIGFADHSPWPEGYDHRFRMSVPEFEEYREFVQGLRQKSSGSVKIRYGLELDWVPGRMDEVQEAVEKEPFDYLLGSIHYVEQFAFDNPELEPEWLEDGKSEWVWRRYPELLFDFVSNFDFDIIAHCDLPKKFGYHPENRELFLSKISKALKVAGEKGMALEINTGGLRKRVKEMYPALDILKLAFQNGLKLTFGSDSHAPDQVGANFADAVELARSAGYSEYVSFEARKSSLHKLI